MAIKHNTLRNQHHSPGRGQCRTDVLCTFNPNLVVVEIEAVQRGAEKCPLGGGNSTEHRVLVSAQGGDGAQQALQSAPLTWLWPVPR